MFEFSKRSYSQIRLAWCRWALIGLMRRWGIYVLVGLLVLGGAGSSALAAITALAAWSVLPLLQAAQQSVGQAVVLTLVYALVGGMLVWGLSPVLWPRAWAEVERALPIVERERRFSDLTVVLLGLTPLFVVYFVGAAIWLMKAPAWFQPVRSWALIMLLTSMALSLALGVAILWWRRGLPATSAPAWPVPKSRRRVVSSSRRPTLSTAMALVLLPLWRGPAQRSGRFLALSLLALLACETSLMVWPLYTSWWLAAFAALAQALTTRLNVLVTTELGALHGACAALPVSTRWLQMARRGVAMAPLVLGLALLPTALAHSAVALQTTAWIAYLAALPLGNMALIAASGAPPKVQGSEDAAARVSGWLVILVLSLALASEVVV